VSNRWLRFVIALLALAAAASATYRVFQQEQQLVSDVTKSHEGELSAESAIQSIGDLKAALHAYVAAGQNHSFWTTRAAMFLDKTRTSLLELDGAASAAGLPVTETIGLLDKVAASEKRARNYVDNGQSLLAGDVIFAEVRDLLDGMRVQVAHARGAIEQTATARQVEIRREQRMLALGAIGILALAVLVLVPPAKSADVEPLVGAKPADAPSPASSATVNPAPPATAEPSEYARVVSKAPLPPGAPKPGLPAKIAVPAKPSSMSGPKTAPASGSMKSGPMAAAPSTARPGSGPVVGAGASSAKAAPAAPPQPPAPPPPPAFSRLPDAAAVCVDLARLSDSNQISALLERAASVLNASGIVVWMASEDRNELFPAASAGYDDRLLTRIGSIARDASNLTAAAFRDGVSRTSARGDASAAALAVPLVTPDGPVGIFSAEIKDVPEVDPARLAVSTIFAAQLSTLLGSIAVAPTAAAVSASEPPPQAAQGL